MYYYMKTFNSTYLKRKTERFTCKSNILQQRWQQSTINVTEAAANRNASTEIATMTTASMLPIGFIYNQFAWSKSIKKATYKTNRGQKSDKG